jgi:hypothetical protein
MQPYSPWGRPYNTGAALLSKQQLFKHPERRMPLLLLLLLLLVDNNNTTERTMKSMMSVTANLKRMKRTTSANTKESGGL